MANSTSSVAWRSGAMVATALTLISSSIDNNFPLETAHRTRATAIAA